MNKTSLPEAIEFMQEIDAWHEFKYSDRQIQLVAPEIRAFSRLAHSEALKIKYNDEKYIIIPHSAILMVIRDEELFD